MADVDRDKLRKRIEGDLNKQLKANGKVVNYHKDLVQDYLSMWDLKNELLDDIGVIGIKVSGMHGPKSNPSIADLHKTNDRMIKILEALNLNVPKTESGGSRDEAKSDLI